MNMASADNPLCPYPTTYGNIICKDGELWALTYSEMGPPDSRQSCGECEYCAKAKKKRAEKANG
jgi:hypothetical protein